MSMEMRKIFINSILVTLIDKSVDLRLIRYLVRTISDWIKYKSGGSLMNQIPSLKEKLVLLQRLAVAVEKRFGDHADIQQVFLETIAYVYKEEIYATNNDFRVKLEQAFLCGLKCTQPKVRQMFFELFNSSFGCVDLYERLSYVIVTQNWEQFGQHYWIKQCVQMTLGACVKLEGTLSLSDSPATARLHFPDLLNVMSTSFITTPEPAVTNASGTGESSSLESGMGTSEPIVMGLDASFSGENLWQDASEKGLKALVNLDRSTEATDFLKFVNKKYMNVYYTDQESEMMNE
jgi:hypothetical protein